MRRVLTAKAVLLMILQVLSGSEGAFRDLDGRPVDLHGQRAGVFFFVSSACPISNQFAPEIQRICREYQGRGISCYLVFVDSDLSADEIRRHLGEYGYDLPAVLDAEHRLAALTGATVTPEAAVLSPELEVLYRGRINNRYEQLGRPRTRVTSHDLRNALDQLLGGQPVSPRFTPSVGCFIQSESIKDWR